MRLGMLAALAAFAWPAAAGAQDRTLVECGALELDLRSAAVGADLSGVRSFYRGDVTLFLIDRVEPACCSLGVAVVMPEQVEEGPGDVQCWAVSGYAGVDVRGATARYDAARGLMLTIPVQDYEPETGGTRRGEPIRLRIDARTWAIEMVGAR